MSSSKRKVYLQLGRTGDILSLLPFFWNEFQQGRRCLVCVHPNYAALMEGLSYVDYCAFECPLDSPAIAMRWLQGKGYDVVVSQFENNPQDLRRLTSNYQRESWRLAGGKAHEFGMWPLVLDNGTEFISDIEYCSKKPLIMYAGDGISSPYLKASELLQGLRDTFGKDFEILNLNAIHASKPTNLLKIMARAAILVSIDTMYLHLARASGVPVVALVNDSTYLASVPPPSAVSVHPYWDSVDNVLLSVGSIAMKQLWSVGRIYHACHKHGRTERHARAQNSWKDLYHSGVVVMAHSVVEDLPRTAKDIGDPRPLPYLKDVLQVAMKLSEWKDDIILWTNDDVAIDPFIVEWADRAAYFGAMSMRRDARHCGRDCFAFSVAWLKKHWDEIPDYIMGCSDFDLGLAAFIRHQRGINSCLKNMAIDFPPCEGAIGLYTHEDHPSEWLVPNLEKVPSISHNRRLFREWAKKINLR